MTMTLPTVDLSGVVGAILRGYEQALVAVQTQVTGDPAAISSAASAHQQQAGAIAAVDQSLAGATTGLQSEWEGAAHDAFAAKSQKLSGSLQKTGQDLTEQANRLTEIAQELLTARSSMDSLLTQFRSIAQTLIAESRTASPLAIGQFIAQAERLGQASVGQAKSISDTLAAVLVKGTSIRKPDDAGFARFELTDPLSSWLSKQSWFKKLYSGVFGGNPNPENLTMGPLGWLSGNPVKPISADGAPGGGRSAYWQTNGPIAADTPWGAQQADPGDGALTKVVKGTQVTLFKPEDSTLYDGTVAEGKQSGSAAFAGGIGQEQTSGYVGPHVTGGESAGISHGQLNATLTGKATLADGTVAGAYDNGPVHAQGSAEGLVGATGDAGLSAGQYGVSAHAHAFAGAEVTGQASADVGGVGVGGEATAMAGIGGTLDGQASYQNGHLVIDARAGAAVGLGATVGGHLDIDVPKIAGEVRTAAQQAATAVGQEWSGLMGR